MSASVPNAAGWFLSREGRPCGPYPLRLLVQLLRAEGDAAGTLVRRDGAGPWSRACEVPEVHAALEGAPPDADRIGHLRSALSARRGQGYLARHWRGELGLGRSFWLHDILVGWTAGAALLSLARLPARRLDDPALVLSLTLPILLLWAGLQTWLKVGTWRSSTAARQMRPSWRIGCVRFLLVCGWIGVGLTVPGLLLPLLAATMSGTPLPVAGATVRAGGTRVDVFGPVNAAATISLRRALEDAPMARLVRLQSNGGAVEEARAMAALIRTRGLDTEASGGCLSACTLVFMAGRHRTLGERGRLGFHSYASPSVTPLALVEAEAADERSLRAQGVPDSFIRHVFATPPARMWFPDAAELTVANVLTGPDIDPGTPQAGPSPAPLLPSQVIEAAKRGPDGMAAPTIPNVAPAATTETAAPAPSEATIPSASPPPRIQVYQSPVSHHVAGRRMTHP